MNQIPATRREMVSVFPLWSSHRSRRMLDPKSRTLHSCGNPRYPIAAQIFCAFSPVNVMSSCVVELCSK